MKKLLALILALVLICAALPAAFADENDVQVTDVMKVVNCEEWVSLRKTPSIRAERLNTVPLGSYVSDCKEATGSFVECTFNGQTGYILAKYLEPSSPDAWLTFSNKAVTISNIEGYGYENLYEKVGNYTVIAHTAPLGTGEKMVVGVFDANGISVWYVTTETTYVSELSLTEAFVGGTASSPMVMVHNSTCGLAALDLTTGRVRWILSRNKVSLGGSISYAVAEDGTMYIGGYYGPDPVCIGVNGNVIWRSSSGRSDIYWLYDIQLQEKGLLCSYEMVGKSNKRGLVLYSYQGKLVEVRQ
ncbi:MAG: hypothetical protein J5859_02865 [Clostridia bacterium]|nr:hypothetical protein [Clostridia bacterium]